MLSIVLRLWKLDVIPPHLTSDEAALGYNAYSILKTGRDEYGEFLPIIFKSFGDYKPGLYIYLTVPFVALLGLNEFSVRLSSALAGVLAVWLVYRIVNCFEGYELGVGGIKKNLLPTTYNLQLGIIAAFLLAIIPWHIHFSRGAWEANISLTLTLLGIFFFLKALEKSKFLILSSLFFSSTLLVYQGAKLATLIVILILTIVFWEKVKVWMGTSRGILAGSFIVGLLISLPIIVSLFQGKTGRLEVFSVFSYPRKLEDINEILVQGKEKLGGLSYYLFHSETLNFKRGILGRWFNHFSGRFLFFEGDYQNPRHSSPNQGMLLTSDLVFLIAGFFALIRLKNSKLRNFIILWLFLAPLPSALSRDQVHAVRAFNMVIPLTLVSALGFKSIFMTIKNLRNKNLMVFSFSFLVFLLFSSLVYYLDSYFTHLPKHNSKQWEYGYKQIIETVTPIQSNYESIKVQQSFAQPYIYFLFYQKYDPAKYQKQAKLVASEYKFDVGYVEKLDNICFCAIDWPQNKKDHGSLVVADDIRIPKSELNSDSVSLIKEINYLDGNTAFRIVEVK